MIRINRSKVRAKPKTIDGVRFGSTAEANRYQELKLALMALDIDSLSCHPSYDLVVEGVTVGRYTPDFLYWDKSIARWVVEEVKGGYIKAGIQRDYPLRRDVFKALNPALLFREVKA
jgi:hypothetical protein